jgi:nucleoside-diphosphate-sugar epimerase
MTPSVAFVTGANGYVGHAVAKAFVRAGWVTYGLVRSVLSTQKLAEEEIIPVVGSIDSTADHEDIRHALPARLDVIVSTTETFADYASHFENIVSLFRTLGAASTAAGRQPTVIFTSGCKDYGIGPHRHGEPNPPPHTEDTPLNPPPIVAIRTERSLTIFQHEDAFRSVLVKPTCLFGRGSTYYQNFFVVARQAAQTGQRLIMEAPPNNVLHALHVDDCADAYVAIASHPRLTEVWGQVFNISARRYETVGEIARALIKEYGI